MTDLMIIILACLFYFFVLAGSFLVYVFFIKKHKKTIRNFFSNCFRVIMKALSFVAAVFLVLCFVYLCFFKNENAAIDNFMSQLFNGVFESFASGLFIPVIIILALILLPKKNENLEIAQILKENKNIAKILKENENIAKILKENENLESVQIPEENENLESVHILLKKKNRKRRLLIKIVRFCASCKSFFLGVKNFTDLQKITLCFSVLSVIILSFAVFCKFDHAFYTFLRWIVCGSTCLLISAKCSVYLRVLLILVAILYNPIAPIHLGDRDTWFVVNLLTIPLIAAAEILSIWRILKDGTQDQR